MKYTLTITENHYNQLKDLLIKEDKLERPAIMLCGRSLIKKDIWDGGPEERFISREIIPIPDDEIISNSNTNVNWQTKTLLAALKKAESKNFAIAVVHNHPNGILEFSTIDDENEPDLFKMIFNRNGGERPHLSIVITPNGEIFGRAFTHTSKNYPLSLIRILGQMFVFKYPNRNNDLNNEIFQRQQLAFGKSLNKNLSKLRIAVVGCGATGSATAVLLARIGVGQILLIDQDIVERTNLNRLHGATAADADAGRAKVDVLGETISNFGIGARVKKIKDWVGSIDCRNAIKSCDIIFGCTDDHAGRIYLNRLAHFYLIPVIDMGILIEVSKSEPPVIEELAGRVTVIFPGNTCLLCRGVIDTQQAFEESKKRSDPLGYERLKEEAYVIGERDPSPSVITFTTEVATMAVNELIHRIQGFRLTGSINNKVRFFHRNEDAKPGAKPREGCRICDSKAYWGRGDMEPFMDLSN